MNDTYTTDTTPHQKGSSVYNIIIAGGGTGGHIFPAVAIANALKQQNPNIQILFVGAKGKMEMEKVPQAGYKIVGLDIAGFDRSSLIKNIGLPFKLIKSFFQVRKIFKEFQPDAAIGVGGYSTFPVLKLAQSKGIPTFIHESNSFAGKANKLLGQQATKIFVATEGMEQFFPKEKIQVTGNPVRKAIVEANISKVTAIQYFGLEAEKTTVLAVGGSLGAKSINQAIAEGLDLLTQNNLQLIWQTGKTTATAYKAVADGHTNIWCNDFITDMQMAYAAADIVISRAGAMAVTELCVCGKPAVFVPFPLAAEDHQTANAKVLVDKQAAILIKDQEAKEKLIPTVVELSKNADLRKWLSANIAALAIKDADIVVAKAILQIIQKNSSNSLLIDKR